MKKTFFVVVVLAVFAPAMAVAQPAPRPLYPAEVEVWSNVKHNVYDGPGNFLGTVTDPAKKVIVMAADEADAERKAGGNRGWNVRFIRWVPQAEYAQIQKQEQQRKEEEQRKERERQAEQQRENQRQQAEREKQLAEWRRDNPPSKFFGTRNSEKEDKYYNPLQSVVVSNDKLKYTTNDGKFLNFNISKWESGDYYGYKLSGIVEDTNLPDNLRGKTVYIMLYTQYLQGFAVGADGKANGIFYLES